ncbi:hypothetical protein [Sphingobium yanoikuyae]|uniref:hypothetical protein n=1 Tax=Sphingobium yanoikuyae TaxID=13690 RepID=UPI0028B199FC|nr:hypothetical protein [Sphingobium yanoikuyae]
MIGYSQQWQVFQSARKLRVPVHRRLMDGKRLRSLLARSRRSSPHPSIIAFSGKEMFWSNQSTSSPASSGKENIIGEADYSIRAAVTPVLNI